MIVRVVLAVLVLGLQRAAPVPDFERGTFPTRWTPATAECATAPAFVAHEYNATFVIIRQSGCTNFEKPFLYLVQGSRQALLVDTSAQGADPTGIVEGLLRRHADRQQKPPLPLVVVHSHGHSDHTAGDALFRKRPNVRVVDAAAPAVSAFFGIAHWPNDPGQYDLGDRVVDVIPIPGHQPASIAIYDRRTEILLTGDTLYPGRLYVRDQAAFADSIRRLVDFTATRTVTHVLGAHIENTSTPFLDYPEGTKFQPEEHTLELGRAHLLELHEALTQMGTSIVRRSFRDFTIWPIAE
jgi:hydroxyacylglutathione hydrolase